MNQTQAFHERIDEALHNDQLRRNFRSALTGIMARRAEQFPDDAQLQALREQARQVRANALVRQPELLERLEAKLSENGIQVHWAETPEQANRIIHEILAAAGAQSVVKGKSMVSEETELNHHLEQHGIEVIADRPYEEKSPAEWAYERLILYIQNFEEQLDNAHEVAMGFTGGDVGVLAISTIDHHHDLAGSRIEATETPRGPCPRRGDTSHGNDDRHIRRAQGP